MCDKLIAWVTRPDITDWMIVILTAAIAYFGWQTGKVHERIETLYARIAWLTGAMESHSELMLLIEAKRGIGGEPIRTIWWDPTVEGPSAVTHREERPLDVIKFFVPERFRKGTEKL
jgi:hypothetical protein